MTDSKCIYIEDIGEDESVCKKGFPVDLTCYSGRNNSCWYYSNYYDPVREEYMFREANHVQENKP